MLAWPAQLFASLGASLFLYCQLRKTLQTLHSLHLFSLFRKHEPKNQQPVLNIYQGKVSMRLTLEDLSLTPRPNRLLCWENLRVESTHGQELVKISFSWGSSLLFFIYWRQHYHQLENRFIFIQNVWLMQVNYLQFQLV